MGTALLEGKTMSDLIDRKALIDFISGVPYMIEHENLRTIVINW